MGIEFALAHYIKAEAMGKISGQLLGYQASWYRQENLKIGNLKFTGAS